MHSRAVSSPVIAECWRAARASPATTGNTDGPDVRPPDLPTDQRDLRDRLGLNGPDRGVPHYQAVRLALDLLTYADVSPRLWASLVAVLEHDENATPIPGLSDPLGRTGVGVRIRIDSQPAQELKVLFDARRQALLFWSFTAAEDGVVGDSHLLTRSARVRTIGTRP
jgi:hypothetical protein